MKQFNLSIVFFLLITLATAIELESLRTNSCKKCLEDNKGSLSKCAKKCKDYTSKLSRYSNKSYKLRNSIRGRKFGRRSFTRSRFGRSRFGRSRFGRRNIKRRRRSRNTRKRNNIKKLRNKKRNTKRKTVKLSSKKLLNQKISAKSKGKLITLKTFQTKKQYYLTHHYWPHWYSYYDTHNYYPYYNFYWFFYGHYHTYFPHYYSYFFHTHPIVHHYHVSNKIIFAHGHPIVLVSSNLAKVETKKYEIVRCHKGPKLVVTVHHKGKQYRIFLGDVNDFTNLGCLYFMDSVVSVGKNNFVKRVSKLYKSKKKVLKVKGKKITIKPFAKNPYSPGRTKVKTINKNTSKLTFTMKRKKSSKKQDKSLLFYHLQNKQYKKPSDSIKIFNGLHKHSKATSNVLYIADHLEPNSIFILKHLLTSYKKMSPSAILRITYRRIRLFSGLALHHHHAHVLTRHFIKYK